MAGATAAMVRQRAREELVGHGVAIKAPLPLPLLLVLARERAKAPAGLALAHVRVTTSPEVGGRGSTRAKGCCRKGKAIVGARGKGGSM